MQKIPITVIAGPTASGKTSLSIELAKRYNGEIVSCDSMQIYRFMNIGTAKPDKEEMSQIVHHMIDILNPDEAFSVAEYVKSAHEVIADIKNRGKNVFIAGGTGLYINSLVDDVDFCENDSDTTIRNELERLLQECGIDYLVDELRRFDPVSAEKIHKNNTRRIIRAIEFYKMTGIPISVHQAQTKKKESRYNPLIMAIKTDMSVLYERIEKRVDIMVEAGLIDEVKTLCDMGYKNAMLSMQGIGYKEVIEHLNGEISLDDAIAKIKLATRHYAKRQMTWFRRDKRICWLDASADVLEQAIQIYEKWNEKE